MNGDKLDGGAAMTRSLFGASPPDPPKHRDDVSPSAGVAGVDNPKFARLPPMPPVRNDAPETSRVAAGRIAGHAGTLRAAVLSMLRERGEHGATDQEIQDTLKLPSNTELPRRWELANMGAVVDSGQKRKTRSNCPATVWVLSEFAQEPSERPRITNPDGSQNPGCGDGAEARCE